MQNSKHFENMKKKKKTHATLVLHIEGVFKRGESSVLQYVDDTVDKFPPVDVDLINYFDLVKMFVDIGYRDSELKKIMWMHPDARDFETGLRPLRSNVNLDIELMCDAYEGMSSSSSSDDYDSAEDSAYRPPPSYIGEEDSDEEEVAIQKKKKVASKPKATTNKLNSGPSNNKKKKVMQEKKDIPNESESDPSSDDDIDDEHEHEHEDDSVASFEEHGYNSYAEEMHSPMCTDDEAESMPSNPSFNDMDQRCYKDSMEAMA
ncbi:hypothetical protein RIF29_26269 [Crotalaria pallida]|uniref:PB1-like domain-containing protein n=1 Tax=Crotalaria pallida TaxID=3830 RepID=A0AAN9ENE7_CROPI